MKLDFGSPRRLSLPIHQQTEFVLVRPHYPENLGAAARALKAMGFMRLAVVRPGRLCTPEHEMAFKMAVKSWDVLDRAQRYDSVTEAVQGAHCVVATTARRGHSRIQTPRELTPQLLRHAAAGQHITILFGNEKTGLDEDEMKPCNAPMRIPMAASQPSINLAQAVQLVAYELLIQALDAQDSSAGAGNGEAAPPSEE
ncbi:MAG TPA: RNA methyltransferase [Polyangiaceae bacterium]|nr:RNA methyltransferase [Polyangiaceae bacterium]